jgi:type II secretory pathway pseudopilin PulG
MKKSPRFTWMTLIEVLLAMIIFGIWIMSIFSAISWSIGSLQESSKRTTAILLAKEWLDIVLYNKNRALTHGLPWNCAKISQDTTQAMVCEHNLLENWETIATYSISYTPSWFYLEKDGIWHLSYTNTTGWLLFTHEKRGSYLYTRRIIITAVPWYEWNSQLILKVQSEVVYGTAMKEQKVVLDSYVWKTE